MTQLTRHKALVEDVAKAMFFNQHSIMHDHDELWRKAEGAFIFRENAEIAPFPHRSRPHEGRPPVAGESEIMRRFMK